MAYNKQFPNSVYNEFKTVEILVNSSYTTGRTDAFVIAWVKSERQVRRIFSYLIYQYPVFEKKDVSSLIQAIASKNNLYFNDFIDGFNRLYPKTYKDIIGTSYDSLKADLDRINGFRNKIFHGQPTGHSLSTSQLCVEIVKIQNWCFEVAEKMQSEIGYDGFTRNSYRKSANENLASSYKMQIKSLDEITAFLTKRKGG
ncbi:MAG: hypothetical protein WA109_01635 [Bellilinea sp.]